ncbi:hypothetical protein J6590_092416 [Homalodisca vitripennis]|nr:hypothetical protein J6590_092416 [Homalodisca vitripennis]
MPHNRRVELPDCRVLLRRLSTEEIGNYLAAANNEAEINIVLPRGNNININDVENPRVNPPRSVLPPRRRYADVPHRVTYRTALLYGAESVETVPMSTLGRFQDCTCNVANLGKVEIPALGPCPEELHGFLAGEDAADVEFCRNIRTVNSNYMAGAYQASFTEADQEEPVSQCTFSNIWRQTCKDIIILRPRSDLCRKCQRHYTSGTMKKCYIFKKCSPIFNLSLKKEIFNEKIKETVENFNEKETFPPNSCLLDAEVHYSFDMAQQVVDWPLRDLKFTCESERLMHFRNNFSGPWENTVVTLTARKRFNVEPSSLPDQTYTGNN